MKKLGLIIASVLFAANAAADGVATGAQPSMAIATAEAGVALQWELPENAKEQRDIVTEDDLEQRSQELNEELEAKLNERLDEKLSRQLQANF